MFRFAINDAGKITSITIDADPERLRDLDIVFLRSGTRVPGRDTVRGGDTTASTGLLG